MRSSFTGFFTIASLFATSLLALTACAPAAGGSGSLLKGNLSIVSVTPTGTTAKSLVPARARTLVGTKAGFTNAPSLAGSHYILSGPPDYLKATLTKITFDGSFELGNTRVDAWTGSQALFLDGVTPIDTSGISLTVPIGTVTAVELSFNPTGAIKGSLTGEMRNADPANPTTSGVTVSTKAAYAYNGITYTGGATSYSLFAGASEETAVTLNLAAGSGDVSIVTPASFVTAKGDNPSLTILVDLSRMLRFYDGQNTTANGGVNPSDPNNLAYFFSHTVFSHSVAAFFGVPGRIQGYEALYAAYQGSVQDYSGTASGVKGWMTLIFAADSSLISGILSENDDNDLTVGKGWIGPSTAAGGAFAALSYSLPPESYNLLGFTPGAAISDYGFFNWNTTANGGWYGEVEYTLDFMH